MSKVLLSLLLASLVAARVDGEWDKEDGAVLRLTDDNFEATKVKGGLFVKFYAPWCGHCKALAPAWEELAGASECPLTIAKLDATIHTSTANKYEIKGFPRLILFNEEGAQRHYSGGRTTEALLDFCSRITGELVAKATADNHEEIRSRKPVSFVLVCAGQCPGEEAMLEQAVYDVYAEKPLEFMVVNDREVGREYSSKTPSLVRWREGDAPLAYDGVVPQSKEGGAPSHQAMSQWIVDNQFPLVTPITDGTAFSTLAKTGKWLVMGLYDGEVMQAQQEAALAQMAKKGDNEQAFGFASLDVGQWDKFVEHRLGVKALPRTVVIEGESVHYEGEGVSLEQLLQRVRRGEAATASIAWLAPFYGLWSKLTRFGVANALEHHWAAASVVLLLVALVFALARFIFSDLAEGGYDEPAARKRD